MRRPSNNPVTLPFGSTESPYSSSNPHKGVDFGWRDSAGQTNKTIYMPEAGVVTLVPNNGNDGNGVYFGHGDRSHGLLHTSQYLVSSGSFIEEGQPVAIMGATGAADGVHLHWALKVNGQFVNGLDYIDEGGNMASNATFDDTKRMATVFFGKDIIAAQGGDGWLQGFVGTPLPDLIKSWAESDLSLQFRREVEAALAKPSTVKPYDGPELFTKG